MARMRRLTAEQHQTLGPWADRWIAHGLATGPLSEVEWARWERGARACYGFAGVGWPGVVVRVPSPLVGALTVHCADHLLRGIAVRDAVCDALRGDVLSATLGSVARTIAEAVDGAATRAVGRHVHGATTGAVDVPVGSVVLGAVDEAADGAVLDAVADTVCHAVASAVSGDVRDAVLDDVAGPVDTVGALNDAVGDTVHDAVDRATVDAVTSALVDAVDRAVRGILVGALNRAVILALDAVDFAVDFAVGDAMGDAMGDAGDGEDRRWYGFLSGHLGAGWAAYLSWFRVHAADILDVPADTWDRCQAWEDVSATAGWWWPTRRYVVVCDRPTAVHLEQVGPPEWGSHRLHRADGPALCWPGWELHYWHGVRVPGSLLDGWSVSQIMAEPSVEVRRAAIERVGWDVFAAQAGLRVVAEAADPGNPGQTLTLYDLPDGAQPYPLVPARLLLATNGSPERDGTRRRYGLPVPAGITDPVAAAAWTYDLNPTVYARLARRT